MGPEGRACSFPLPLWLSTHFCCWESCLVQASPSTSAIWRFAFQAFQVLHPSPETSPGAVMWPVMIGLAIALDVVIPAAERQSIVNAGPGQYTHVSATVSDDGSATYVVIGGDLTVDLSGWPSSEWSGVQFKTSNPSVLSLDAAPTAGGP